MRLNCSLSLLGSLIVHGHSIADTDADASLANLNAQLTIALADSDNFKWIASDRQRSHFTISI